MAHGLYTLLEERGFLLADGATGTNLFAMGLPAGHAPELWNAEAPGRVASLHRAFIASGADVILSNSFGGNRYRLALHGAQARVGELNEAAARIAREEADRADRPVLVAGSMGPTGELLQPLGALSPEEVRLAYAEQARALAAGGVDLLWIETMSSREEAEAAIAGASEAGLPVTCTLSFDTNGHTMMGLTPADYAQACAHMHPPPAGFGSNCGVGAAEVVAGVLAMRGASGPDAVLIAKANCGIPHFVDGAVRYDGTPELMARYACLARDAGARIIGGCCGTTPEHLRAMRAALDHQPTGAPPTLEGIVETLGPITTLTEGKARPKNASRRARARTHGPPNVP